MSALDLGKEWHRVTPASPCPICAKGSWCTVAPDGSAARCKRNASDQSSPGEDGDAWIHELRPGVRMPPQQRGRDDDNDQAWEVVARENQQRITDPQVDTLARCLGVEAIALREFGIGWDGECWTFPMFAADGSVCGIRRRPSPGKGKKHCVTGSRLGVFRRLQPDDGQLLITEGESDAVAALSLGFDAIGVPGKSQCTQVAAVYARGRDVVVIGDNDESGKEGVHTLTRALVGVAKSVRVVYPPEQHKDLREWLRSPGIRDNHVEVVPKLTPAVLASAIASASPILSEPLLTAGADTAAEEAPDPFDGRWFEADRTWTEDEPPAQRWLVRARAVLGLPPEGLIARGVVALLAGAGGIGKTEVALGLAIAVLTGGRWLDVFPVDDCSGRVLVLAAEEDIPEMRRRVHRLTRHLPQSMRAQLHGRLVIAPMHSRDVGILTRGKRGPVRSEFFTALRKRLNQQAGQDGWAAIIMGPMSRLAGLPIDVDNDIGTKVMQAMESLCDVAGEPLVFIDCHTNAASRKPGQTEEDVTVRGPTGLTDAARLVFTMHRARKGAPVVLAIKKSNRAPDEAPSLQLERGADGLLRCTSFVQQTTAEDRDEERRQRKVADVEDTVEIVVATLRRQSAEKSQPLSKETVVTASGRRAVVARAAFELAEARGLVRPAGGTSKRPLYLPADVAVGSSQGEGEAPPIPPSRDGTGRPGTRPSRVPSRGRKRTGRDGIDSPAMADASAHVDACRRLGTELPADAAQRHAAEIKRQRLAISPDDGLPEKPRRRRKAKAGGS